MHWMARSNATNTFHQVKQGRLQEIMTAMFPYSLFCFVQNLSVVNLRCLFGKFADGDQPTNEFATTPIGNSLKSGFLVVISAQSGESIHFNVSETDLT